MEYEPVYLLLDTVLDPLIPFTKVDAPKIAAAPSRLLPSPLTMTVGTFTIAGFCVAASNASVNACSCNARSLPRTSACATLVNALSDKPALALSGCLMR